MNLTITNFYHNIKRKNAEASYETIEEAVAE